MFESWDRVFCLILLLGAASALPSCQAGSESRPPNIVLLMGDDHGWEETAYNGHPYLQTPVLDEMAASGLRMDRFYSAAPVCSPTRGSVLTGRHPNRYGTFSANWSIRPEEVTLAQILKESGYRCGHFGKWHLGPVAESSPVSPGALGFDEWLSHDNFFEMNPPLSRNGAPPRQFEGEGSEVIVEAAIEFIEQSKREGKPFLVVLWFGSPHEPYGGLEEDLRLYDGMIDQYPGRSVRLTSMETGLPVTRPLGEVLRERYAEITAMDRSIGRLRDFLASAGEREKTLLWYCGDNGTPESGHVDSKLRGLKGTLYEGGIRVPGIIEWPGRIGASATTVPVVTSDILPTLVELSGLRLPERPMDGISLRSLFDGGMQERPSAIHFWEYDIRQETSRDRESYIESRLLEGTTPLVKQMGGVFTRTFRNLRHIEIREADFWGTRAILDGPYKLVVQGLQGEQEKVELFHLEEDPAEESNRAGEEPDRVRDLKARLGEWQESVLLSLTGADYR